MITKNKSLDERCLEIYEDDVMNNCEILIVSVYCTRVNNGMWQFPAPQIWNETIYNKYREKYDAQIVAFRNDCESITVEKGSILMDQLADLQEELNTTQAAINELLFGEAN